MLSSLLLSSLQHTRRSSARCIAARRHITSAQKRALKRKQANNTSTSDAITSNQVSSPSGTTKNNIPKAPHMHSQVFESTAAGKKNGVLDTIKDNPLIFAIFVFPTVMMGVALIVRPDFRAQILGGGGNGGDKDKTKMRSNASINVPDDAPAPVYEETNVSVVAAAITTTNDKENDAKDTKKEEGASQKNSNTKSVNLQQNENELGDENESKGGGEVKDLIYALGIRPHPSL